MAIDCKLCFKRFSNGKALGAHMRSHYAILPLPPKRHQLTEPPTESTSAISTDDTQSSADLSGTYNNKKRSDPEFHDVESETGSTRARGGNGFILNDDDLGEDDVALCLIMLSRDVWSDSTSSKKIFRCEKCYKVFKSSQGLGSHRATHFKKVKNNSSSFLERERERENVVHECALCPRIFKSAQALGGHKRSHFPPTAAGTNLLDLNLPMMKL